MLTLSKSFTSLAVFINTFCSAHVIMSCCYYCKLLTVFQVKFKWTFQNYSPLNISQSINIKWRTCYREATNIQHSISRLKITKAAFTWSLIWKLTNMKMKKVISPSGQAYLKWNESNKNFDYLIKQDHVLIEKGHIWTENLWILLNIEAD